MLLVAWLLLVVGSLFVILWLVFKATLFAIGKLLFVVSAIFVVSILAVALLILSMRALK